MERMRLFGDAGREQSLPPDNLDVNFRSATSQLCGTQRAKQPASDSVSPSVPED